MSDPSSGGPDQAQMQQYLEQLRGADPAEIIVQAWSMIGTGAEVKLGQPDARLLIDAMAGLTEAVADRMPDELSGQMRGAVQQLQLAQVQAESGTAPTAATGAAEGDAQPDATGAEQPASSEPAQPSSPPRTSEPPGQKGQSPADRLWIPGRDG